jgi:predicted DsbA family dithiol-disulfide isomerase
LTDALANTIGLADQLLGNLQRTLFSGRANVYDHTVLANFASRLGILRSRAEEVLSSNEYADAVRADEKEAKTLGATGVPFSVFDGRIAIPGATSIEGFTNAINRAWSDK